MSHDIRRTYWWPNMKNDLINFVQKCLTYQQIEAEHTRSGNTLQPLEIHEWKWECIAHDFVFGLLNTRNHHDSIWVIVNKLTKSVLFILIKMDFTLEKLARLYISEIESYHGVPREIVLIMI